MKLIIEIPDKMYKTVQDGTYCGSLFEELKNGISVEQCGDCIRRSDIEDAIYDISRGMDLNYGQIMEYIDKIPSVTPQPKMGQWIVLKDEYDDVCEAVCSCCDKNGNHKWAFCPYCGAKMSEIPTGQIVANGELYPGEFDDPLAEEGSDKE